MRLIQPQNMTACGLFGKTENSLIMSSAVLISGIIFGAETVEQEKKLNFTLWASPEFRLHWCEESEF